MPEAEMTALAGEPLPVEFCHAGTWYPAVLLGWRHRRDGSCDVRVRFVADGLRRSTWLPLTDVRLPAPVRAPDRLLPGRDWSRPLRPLQLPDRRDEDRSRI